MIDECMVYFHKFALFLVVAVLMAINLYARTGVPITWSYKGHFHRESAEHIRVLSPSSQSDDVLIPVEDVHSLKDTGQRVQVELVNAYCVPSFRGLADDNLLVILLGGVIVAITWMLDRVRAKRYALRSA